MDERRYDIDWLRVIAMLTVFVYHSSRFFCTEGWELKAPPSQQSEMLRILREAFIDMWFMELFFLVAGFATWYALRSRSAGRYLLDRVKRLLVPLYTVGLLILVMPQKYFDGVTNGYITGTFRQWLPSYYLTLPGSVLSSWRPGLDPAYLLPYPFAGHLWFIQTLFVISLVALPLFLLLRSERGRCFIEKLAGWVARPGGIFLFLIPLVVAQIALRWVPEVTDRSWADFVWFALFFVIGYIIAADARFAEGIRQYGWLCLGLWFGLYVIGGGTLEFVFHYRPETSPGFSLLYVIRQITWSTITWCAVAFMLSLGAKYLNFSNRLLTYSNEAVLPFYLFHQTVILTVGWFVLPWNLGSWASFFIIAAVSFPLILILYEGLVRRIGLMRFLFGMAPPKKQPTAPGG